MSKVVAVVYASLDGVIDNPEWSMPYFNDEAGEYAGNQVEGTGALLLGRETYEGFAEAWPNMPDEDGFATKMNTLPKYVVSTTLKKAEWGPVTIISKNVAEEVSKLKKKYKKDILIYGVGRLAYSLLDEGLLDELQIWVHPILVGKPKGGGGLLALEGTNAPLELLEAKTLSTGITILRFKPAEKEKESAK
ncbi:dihydrofolate reductase family protein [Sphaerisporangium flaviroseum]|uniref:Dihydrofolate reductase family protein n=1 Tax=Sphaerisporangium flaviroseum TaxID=509199 RepID=A0ABP7HLP8_9ACTN